MVMNKKLVLLLTIIMVATLVFVACDQTEEFEGKFDNIPDRAYAVESEYAISVAYELKFGEQVPYPIMTEMENLSKQRVINGAFSTRALKVGSDTEGNPGMVFDTYEVMFESANLMSVRFIANEGFGKIRGSEASNLRRFFSDNPRKKMPNPYFHNMANLPLDHLIRCGVACFKEVDS